MNGCEGFEQADAIEKELTTLAAVLSDDNNWRECKALHYLAKIEESRENITAAIDYVQRALLASEGSAEGKAPIWAERHREYLDHLQSRYHAAS